MFYSIICSYTDKKILDEYLCNSLKKQSFRNFELILINSKEKKFKSASSTLNYGASISKGQYLLFVHQDVRFTDVDFLLKLYEVCLENTFAILGFAGVLYSKKVICYSNIIHGANNNAGIQFKKVRTDCQTLDECMFVIPKFNFSDFDFIGNTWHLYAVGYCLKVKSQGKIICLSPLSFYHLSEGKSFNMSYFYSLNVLRKKYNRTFEYICTTIGIWPTNFIKYNFFVLKRKILYIKKRYISHIIMY